MVGTGLLPAIQQYVLLVKAAIASREAELRATAGGTLRPLSRIDPAVGIPGVLSPADLDAINQLCDAYLPAGLNELSLAVKAQSIGVIGDFTGTDVITVSLSFVALFVLYVGYYLPTILLLDAQLKRTRFLLLLCEFPHARAHPSNRLHSGALARALACACACACAHPLTDSPSLPRVIIQPPLARSPGGPRAERARRRQRWPQAHRGRYVTARGAAGARAARRLRRWHRARSRSFSVALGKSPCNRTHQDQPNVARRRARTTAAASPPFPLFPLLRERAHQRVAPLALGGEHPARQQQEDGARHLGLRVQVAQ